MPQGMLVTIQVVHNVVQLLQTCQILHNMNHLWWSPLSKALQLQLEKGRQALLVQEQHLKAWVLVQQKNW
jgi:hypothetical protein